MTSTDVAAKRLPSEMSPLGIPQADTAIQKKSNIDKILPTPSIQVEDTDARPIAVQIRGFRFQFLNLSLCLCLFLSTLESTVVGTALVPITNDLGGFRISSWVITSYLLTYTGFLTILAKLSDIFGRRAIMIVCLVLFIAFSVACGLVRSIEQLIIFRAFQGIGGGGIYTMTFVILPEIVPKEKYAVYAGIISGVAAMSSLLGPIFGGVISDQGTWKWIFFLNAPAGAVALILFYFTLPRNFPHPPNQESMTMDSLRSKLRRIDFIGALILLSSSILLVTAIEEGGIRYSWKSALVLTLLVLSVILLFGNIFWSRYLLNRTTKKESILPWIIMTDKYAIGLLLVCLFTGLAFITCIIILPQKFQVVYGDSASEAGYRLLALTLITPIGSAISGILLQKARVPPLYVFLGGWAFIMLGAGLLTTMAASREPFPIREYGYQIIMGFGFGINLATVVMAAPLAFSAKNLAVGMGISNQFRVLGGCIGVSICANILNSRITNKLTGILSPDQIKTLLGSANTISTLPAWLRDDIRGIFAVSFVHQMRAILGLSAGGLCVTLLMIERRPRFQQ